MRRRGESKVRGLLSALAFSCLLHLLLFLSSNVVLSLNGGGAARSDYQPFLTATLTAVRAVSLPAQIVPVTPELQKTPPTVEAFSADGADLSLAGKVYYFTDQLTLGPSAMTEPVLRTAETDANLSAGRVILLLRIGQNGDVEDVTLEQSDLPEIFGQVAKSAFSQLRFQPGELNGRKVGALMRIEVVYEESLQ